MSASDVSPSSTWLAWWKCDKGPDHEWSQDVASRFRRRSTCPCCKGRKLSITNALTTMAPQLMAEWDADRNIRLSPDDFSAFTSRSVWWHCNVASDHVWRAPINGRAIHGEGCPFCHHTATVPSTSLASRAPELSAQWHPTRNGTLRADQVALTSHRRVWWKCAEADDHEWQANVISRSKKLPKIGCPMCAGKILCASNSLAEMYPLVAAEWHQGLNGKITPNDVVGGSSLKFWWQCRRDHVWQAMICSRTRRRQGCRKCAIILRYGNPVMTGKRRMRVTLPSDWE